MKKLILILIPIIWLSSCTIDWNDEQAKKITALEQEISDLKAAATPAKPQETPKLTSATGMIDVWLSTGFTLSQTTDVTTLMYKGKSVKTWSHTPPKESPFVFDEWCSALSEKLVAIPDNDMSPTSRRGAWESLGTKVQKECLRENYKKTLTTETTSGTGFFLIQKTWYESAQKWLFDTKTLRVYDLGFAGLIKKVEVWTRWVYVLSWDGRGNDGGVLFLDAKTGKGKSLFQNTDDEKSLTATDFELLPEQKIRIMYLEAKVQKEETISVK